MLGVTTRNRTGQNKGSYGIIKESKKDNHEYKFKENNKKMTHHPARAKIINVTNF